HTSCYRDWSSDVCSSDLGLVEAAAPPDTDLADCTRSIAQAAPPPPQGRQCSCFRTGACPQSPAAQNDTRARKEHRQAGWYWTGVDRKSGVEGKGRKRG